MKQTKILNLGKEIKEARKAIKARRFKRLTDRQQEVARFRLESLKDLKRQLQFLVRDAKRAERKGGIRNMFLRNGEWLVSFTFCINVCKRMGIKLPSGVAMSEWIIK